MPWLIVAGVAGYLFLAGVTCGICQHCLEFCREANNQPASTLIGLAWPFSLPAVTTLLACRFCAWLFRKPESDREWTDKEQAALLDALPEDAAEGFESLRLAIRRHKADGWSDVSQEDMLDVLDILEDIAAAEDVAFVMRRNA